jgi:hypothetical protein
MKLQPILLELTKFGMNYGRMRSFLQEVSKLSGKSSDVVITNIGIQWRGRPLIGEALYFIFDFRLFRDWLASQNLWTEEELAIFDPYICLELAEG